MTGEADTLGEPSAAVQAANEEAIAKIKGSSYHDETHDTETHDTETHDADVFQVTTTQGAGNGIVRGKWCGRPIQKSKM